MSSAIFFNLYQSTILPSGLKAEIVWQKFNFLSNLENSKHLLTEKDASCLKWGGKHCGKRMKCRLLKSSPFPTMFSKGFITSVVKNLDWVVQLWPLLPLYGSVIHKLITFNPFPKQALVFTCLLYKSFKNTVDKEEIARNEQFLLFPPCFLSFWRTFHHFRKIWNCYLRTFSVQKGPKFVLWKRVKSFRVFKTQDWVVNGHITWTPVKPL